MKNIVETSRFKLKWNLIFYYSGLHLLRMQAYEVPQESLEIAYANTGLGPAIESNWTE